MKIRKLKIPLDKREGVAMFGQEKDDNQQSNGQSMGGQTTDAPSAADIGLGDEGTDSSSTSDQPAMSIAPGHDENTVQPISPTQPGSDNASDGLTTDDSSDTDLSAPLPDDIKSSPVLSGSTDQATNDLLKIKQDALQHLSPLVDHIDQTPEEKFRTTMMMIQASDDQKLVKTAYEAAQKITDDKERAQALLDIINEINYFSQQKPKN